MEKYAANKYIPLPTHRSTAANKHYKDPTSAANTQTQQMLLILTQQMQQYTPANT